MATDHFDDPNIPDEERLFRRIHLTHIVEGDGGKSEVSSAEQVILENAEPAGIIELPKAKRI